MLGNIPNPFAGKDTIGGVLALGFSAATIYLWVTNQPVPGELLVVNTVVVQNYINRGNGTTGVNVESANVRVAPLAPPAYADDDDRP